MATRFLTLADVAETLNLTMSATRALVSSGELPAIQVGGKHVWRIEESVLEQFIQDQYTATRERQKAERAQLSGDQRWPSTRSRRSPANASDTVCPHASSRPS